MTRPDGMPVNAVFGFTNMLAKLLREHVGTHIAVIFDAGRVTFRNRLYDDYKAHRPPPPEELIPQFALIREATEAFCVPAIELADWEADDLIAAYAVAAEQAGGQVTIVSSDKDLMQLIRPGVEMLDPIKQKPIGPPEVMEKFGVTPDKMVEVQALIGDSVDNVPGVPGIGPKGAAQLINEFGDLETVLAAAPAMKPSKRRDTLIEHAEKARISRELVKLRADAPLPTPVDRLVACEPDKPKLAAWLRVQGFRSVATRLGLDEAPAAARAVEAGPRPTQVALPLPAAERPALEPGSAEPFGPYQTLTTESALREFLAETQGCGFLAIDTETDGVDPMRAQLVGIALAVAAGRAAYLPLRHEELAMQVPLEAAIAALDPVLTDPAVLKIFHHAKFDMLVLTRAGFANRAPHGMPYPAPYDDTMLISYAQEAGMHAHGLDELAQLHLGHTPVTYDAITGTGRNRLPFAQVPIERATAYAAEDADVALRLWQALRPRLRFNKSLALYEQMERRLTGVLMDMERAGIKVDADDLRRMSVDFEQRMAVMEKECHRLAGFEFNVGSPKQLGEVLFDQMGLPGGKRMKTGAWGTDSSVLQTLADQGQELPAKILDWRQLQKLKSTYADALVRGDQSRHRPRAYQLRAGDRLDRAAVVERSEPAEHPDPHRGRQPHPPRLHRRAGPRAGQRRLLADRTASARPCRRHPGAARKLRPRRGHPRAHRLGSVRRADGRHGPDDPAAGEGDQFRHHLRHQRLRPGAAVGHHARRGTRLHRPVLRTLSRHPHVHGAYQGGSPDQRLRGDSVRAALLGAGHRRQEPGTSGLCRAAGDQRAVAGRCRGHHQAGDDPLAVGPARRRPALPHAAPGA